MAKRNCSNCAYNRGSECHCLEMYDIGQLNDGWVCDHHEFSDWQLEVSDFYSQYVTYKRRMK